MLTCNIWIFRLCPEDTVLQISANVAIDVGGGGEGGGGLPLVWFH